MKHKLFRVMLVLNLGFSALTTNASLIHAQTTDSTPSRIYLPLVQSGNQPTTTGEDVVQTASTTTEKEQPAVENPSPYDQPVDTAIPSDDLAKRALDLIAQRTGIAVEMLTTVNTAAVHYPLQAISGFSFKIVDGKEGIYGVTLNDQGKELDSAKLIDGEVQAYFDKYGRLEVALAEQLAQADEATEIDVQIWLQEPDQAEYTGPQRPNPQEPFAEEAITALYAKVDAYLGEKNAALVAPIYEKIKAFAPESSTDEFMPIIYATLRPEAIREIATWDAVNRIYLSPVNEPALDVARPAVHANVVHDRGITGLTLTPDQPNVAVIEVGGRINTANPNLPGVVQDTTFSCVHPHGTAVAGIVGSKHKIHRGIAPSAKLWIGGSCSGFSSQLQNRSTAAANAGVRTFNLSWGPRNPAGALNADDRYYDSLVLNRWRTVVPSAGNVGATTGWVGNPGAAYNVITVGSSSDQGTMDWADDTMASYSSWRDPSSVHNDREKPEVAAPGSEIQSATNADPWIGSVGSGTSYAAPVVTGISALLMEREPALAVWPESVKSILMATAVHNIEGASALSEWDGAGGVTADLADNVARRVSGLLGGDWGGQSYSCNAATTTNLVTMALTAGAQTRATVTWDTDPNYSAYHLQPGADLDIQIQGPNGYVTGSYSWDNGYETVEFVPAVAGNYTLQVNKFRCSYNPQWLGWAMFQNETTGRQLVSAHSNKCADVASGSISNGGNVLQWGCHNGSNQRWVLGAVGPHYKLTALHSGLVLDVSGASTSNGANVHQWGWWGGNNQLWDLVPAGSTYELKAVHSGKCLDVDNGGMADGTNILQWGCHGGSNQKWRLQP